MAIKVKLPYKVGQKIDLGIPGGTGDVLRPTVVLISSPIFHPETKRVFGIFLTYQLHLSTGGTRDDTIGITFFVNNKKLIQDQSWLVGGWNLGTKKPPRKIMDTMEFYLSLTKRKYMGYVK